MLGACRTEPPAAGGDRLARLESRVARLEARLAETEADPEELQGVEASELLARLDSADVLTRYRAAAELARRGTDAHAQVVEALRVGSPRQREAAAAVLASGAGPDDVPLLLLARGSAEGATDRALVDVALGRTGSSDAVAPLVEDLGNPARRVRLAAVDGLKRLGRAQAMVPLLRLALSDDPVVSPLARDAARSLPAEAFLFLDAEWKGFIPRERADVLGIVGDMRGTEARSFLVERLQDASPTVALRAALELARQADPAGEGVARAFLSSEDPVVARSARDVLDALESVRNQ